MILIKPSFEVLGPPINQDALLASIELYGRTCYKSEDAITPNSAKRFVEMLIRRGHESVIEHEKITVKIVCDRGVSHEIVRHRIASYSQESTRYCDYANGHVTFVIPPWVSVAPGRYDHWVSPAHRLDEHFNKPLPDFVWLHCISDAERHYRELRDAGWRPEQARSVLPNSLKTEIVVTYNLREWRHFLRLRTSPAAHPQMREIACMILDHFKDAAPVLFGDIS